MNYTMQNVIEMKKITANTLRFYEKEGLLKNVQRDHNNRRIYDENNLEWIACIQGLRRTGMPINKIKEYVDLYEGDGSENIEIRKEILKNHKTLIMENIQEQLAFLETINYKLALYEFQESERERTI